MDSDTHAQIQIREPSFQVCPARGREEDQQGHYCDRGFLGSLISRQFAERLQDQAGSLRR